MECQFIIAFMDLNEIKTKTTKPVIILILTKNTLIYEKIAKTFKDKVHQIKYISMDIMRFDALSQHQIENNDMIELLKKKACYQIRMFKATINKLHKIKKLYKINNK